jgi:hypothetical protein
MADPRTPDFLILGAAKAGTTALSLYLSQHPGVFMPAQRETNFFALEGAVPAFSGPGDASAVNHKAVTRWEDYLDLFAQAPPTCRVGECSPLYLYHPLVADRVVRRLPEVRLIVVLRQPADRAYASYLHLVRDGRETASFEEGLAREAERIAAGYEHLWHYREMGFYGRQLQRYFDRFDARQIHVVRYEEFQQTPERVLAGLFAFLGVDPTFTPDRTRRPNRSGVPRYRRLFRMLAGATALRSWMPEPLRGRAATLVQQVLLRRPPMPDGIRRRLLDGYREDTRVFERLAGIDLSDWFVG